jgi:hypothetical protein
MDSKKRNSSFKVPPTSPLVILSNFQRKQQKLFNFYNSMQKSVDERIILNVGGIRYETYKSTLLKYPNTLLSAMFSDRNKDLLVKDANG